MTMTTKSDPITSVDYIDLATYLKVIKGYTFVGLEGPSGGHRTFRFAEPIDPTDIGEFYSSREKRVLDAFRAFKGLLTRSA
jgi:hypothetical protein